MQKRRAPRVAAWTATALAGVAATAACAPTFEQLAERAIEGDQAALVEMLKAELDPKLTPVREDKQREIMERLRPEVMAGLRYIAANDLSQEIQSRAVFHIGHSEKLEDKQFLLKFLCSRVQGTLTDEFHSPFIEAAKALRRLREAGKFPPLMDCLAKAEDPIKRKHIILAMSDIPAPENGKVDEALIELLKLKKDDMVEEAAIFQTMSPSLITVNPALNRARTYLNFLRNNWKKGQAQLRHADLAFDATCNHILRLAKAGLMQGSRERQWVGQLYSDLFDISEDVRFSIVGINQGELALRRTVQMLGIEE